MKKLLWMLVTLCVVLAITAIAVPYFISSDVFRKQIEQQVEMTLGRNVKIAGAVHLRLFPLAGATLEDVTIRGFKETASEPLARLKVLRVDLALLPLLRKDIEIQSLVLKYPQINLQINLAGENNWHMGGVKKKGNTASAEDVSASSELVLKSVKIVGGSIRYQNAQARDEWILDKVDVDTSFEGFDAPFEIRGSAEWNGKAFKSTVKLGSLQDFVDGISTRAAAVIQSDFLNADAEGEMNARVYTGAINASSPSLKSLMVWLNPRAKPLSVNAPLAFNLKGKANCSENFCNLTDASLSLDALKATGKIKTSLSGGTPYIEAEIAADMLDINPFLSTDKKQASNTWLFSEAFAKEGWNSDPIDLSVLRQVNASVSINAGGVRMGKITIGKTLFRSKIQKGQLSADIVDAEFYQGKANITLNINTNAERPIYEKRVAMRGVEMEAFFKDAADSDRLSGTGEMQVNSTSYGNSQQELVASTSGSGNFHITDGAFKGFNIADMVRNIQSAYKDVDLSAQKTDFAELSGSFTIANGIMSNNDLAMKAPLMRLSGKGQINLPQQTIDYRLMPQVVETNQGQGGKDKAGIGVPVIVEGSLEHPQFRPDVRGIVEDALKDPDKFKQQIKDTKGAVKDLLKGFKKKKPQ